MRIGAASATHLHDLAVADPGKCETYQHLAICWRGYLDAVHDAQRLPALEQDSRLHVRAIILLSISMACLSTMGPPNVIGNDRLNADGWAEATRLADLPTSHREGSLFVTTRGRLPWGDVSV